MTEIDDKAVVLGRISGVYGVRGWVKVHSYTSPREAILGYREWLVGRDGERRALAVVDARPQGKTLVASIEGVGDRDQAAELIDAEIAVMRSALPETAADEYYWSDLEGLRVRRTSGEVLGTVARLLETGANDVLVVTNGNDEVLIPFVTDRTVVAVDIPAGEITVDWEWD